VEKGGRKKYITEMEEAPENGKELSHSAHANGMNECVCVCVCVCVNNCDICVIN
jgi:hypothetical protein